MQVFPNGDFSVRTSLVETFQSTMSECFIRTVRDMLGSAVTSEVCRLLERNGIPPRDIASRFDEVVDSRTHSCGSSPRALAYKTVASLYERHSLRPSLGYDDSPQDRVRILMG